MFLKNYVQVMKDTFYSTPHPPAAEAAVHKIAHAHAPHASHARRRIAAGLTQLDRPTTIQKVGRVLFPTPELRGLLVACAEGKIPEWRHRFVISVAQQFGGSTEFDIVLDDLRNPESLVRGLARNSFGATEENRLRNARERLRTHADSSAVEWLAPLYVLSTRLDTILPRYGVVVAQEIIPLMAAALEAPDVKLLPIMDTIYPKSQEFVDSLLNLEAIWAKKNRSVETPSYLQHRFAFSWTVAETIYRRLEENFSLNSNRERRAEIFFDTLIEASQPPNGPLIPRFEPQDRKGLVNAAVKVRNEASRTRSK